jgi:DNA helicase-2/ATP-dependent DNA helicase PcrA
MKQYTVKKSAGHLRIDYENELNEQQYDAVRNINGPHLVIAGAGSGKTRALVYRVAYLVEHGVDPRQILLLTFTRKAAQEMMRRASSMLDDRCMAVAGGTFHSFAAVVLRKYGEWLGYAPSFSIIDRSDSEDIVAMMRSELGITTKNRRFPKKKTTLDIISRAVNTGRTYGDIILEDYPQFIDAEGDIREIAKRYRSYKVSKSIMDYDDLLVNLRDLLRDHEGVRNEVASQYRYIMVDEYQDTNAMQAQIVRLLASEHGNVMVVGDDSQSIYSFRGANFKNIIDFPAVFPGCTVTTMEQNYRSAQPILFLTNRIIENAREKYSKELFSHIDGRQKPVYLRARSERDQALFVCQRVLELLDDGVPLSDIAVLFRSGWHSNALEIELNNRGIPYVKYGGLKFVESAHVKDMSSLLRVVFNPSDVLGWYRVLRLHEGIGGKTAGDITREIVDNRAGFKGLVDSRYADRKYSGELKKLYDVIDRVASSDCTPAEEVRIMLEYYLPLLERIHDDYKKRVNDLESLIHIAGHYETMEQFLTDLSIEPPDSVQDEAADGSGKLVLSTVHSAKGLEWDSVFVINLVDGYFPSSYSFYRDDDIEEERRLFYVAATRAKRHLYLIAPEVDYPARGYGYVSRYAVPEPSRFITELGDLEELTEQWVLEFEESLFS